MIDERHDAISKRIHELYKLLTKKQYQIYIAPQFLINTLEDLESRSITSFEGSDTDVSFYEEPQLRTSTVEGMLKFLPNLYDVTDLGFRSANTDLVEVYENCLEYVRLWIELVTARPFQLIPPLNELRMLENLAFFLYPNYRRIINYLKYKKTNLAVKQQGELDSRGLLGLSGIFSLSGIEGPKGKVEEGFYSYVDHYEASLNTTTQSTSPIDASKGLTGGLVSLLDTPPSLSTPKGKEDASWIFGG